MSFRVLLIILIIRIYIEEMTDVVSSLYYFVPLTAELFLFHHSILPYVSKIVFHAKLP